MRTMYDGINSDAAGIAKAFPDAVLVAGYLTGPYQWTAAEWALFPHAQHVTMVTTAQANAGDVLDVEAGDATPAQTQGWIAVRKRSGLWRPTIYCSLNTVPAVRIGTGPYRLGVDYDLWVADWDGVAVTVPYGAVVAKQFKSAPGYDVSTVFDGGWPHRTAPVPVPVKPGLAAVDVTAHYSDGSSKMVAFP